MRLCIALALMFGALTAPSVVPARDPAARVHNEQTGDDFLISCHPAPLAADYQVETASGVPLSGVYASARGADKGLVRLMFEHGRRVKRFVIARGLIQSVVTVKLDQVLPDKVDILVMPTGLMIIHTSTSNAGIFTDSDVYKLPFDKPGHLDRRPLKGSPDVAQSLDLGLAFYEARSRGDSLAHCSHPAHP